VYFAGSFDMPPVPETNVHGEIGGGFLVGDGHYSAALALTDDLGRACSHAWQIDAHFERSARGLQSALAPGAVTDLSWAPAAAPREPAFGRLTVLLHAAPAWPRASLLQADDLERWLGELASLLEQAPARLVRLVVFSLAQQKVLFREDDFHLDDLNRVAETIYNLQLATVDYHALQRPTGDADLLAEMVNREMGAAEPSQTVIFVGPYGPSPNHVPRGALRGPPPGAKGPPQRYYYVQYWAHLQYWADSRLPHGAMPRALLAIRPPVLPFQGRLGSRGDGDMVPVPTRPPTIIPADDIISSLVAMLKGKTLDVHSPADFVKALRKIGARK